MFIAMQPVAMAIGNNGISGNNGSRRIAFIPSRIFIADPSSK
jgi:hypothetical protein